MERNNFLLALNSRIQSRPSRVRSSLRKLDEASDTQDFRFSILIGFNDNKNERSETPTTRFTHVFVSLAC